MSNYFVVAVILFLGCANCNVVKNPANDDPCKGKEDGIYGTGDSFGYMTCKNQHASYVSCGNELFDACTKRCVNPEQVNMGNICECRSNGNVMDPWNCHKYITCSNGYHYLFNCSRPQLVYDPSVDRCVQPAARPCKEVKKESHYLHLVPQKRNWNDAQANCKKLGGNLATIVSGSENAKIFSMISKSKIDVAWFGYNDIAVEGHWVWVGRKTSYANWHKGEPNNLGNEDCGSMIRNWNGQWNDYSCNNQYASVCEIPTSVSVPKEEEASGLTKIMDMLFSWKK